MLSGQIGHYKYYELSDMWSSPGCKMCPGEDRCNYCPILMCVKLTKLYAQELNNYRELYEDDGK